ncbi:hypothetical protein ES708_11494 [subsurface metagenome]
MKKKIFSILFALVLVLSFSLATAVPVVASETPTINGVLGEGEWGAPAFGSDYFDVYVLNDTEYLYVAFETLGGTYLPTGGGDVGMMNLYVMNPVTEECWAYCWIHRTPGLIELKYTDPPNPQETLVTGANFGVTATAFELRVPLSELESINPGDTINFHFMSYAQGLTDWDTCWLYNQEYTLAPPPPILVTIDIKPGSDPNSINLKSRGVLPVAVLTTDDFDASTVDPSTVVFADASPVRWTMEDVDSDGDLDLLLHFKTQELNLTEESTEVTLTSETVDGQPIQGTDTVNIVPKGKA